MDSGLLGFVNDYGYLAVFLLVFLQEIGIPNPVPNELVLLFAGALTSVGGLSVWLMFFTAVAADVIGTTIVFSVFYFF
jgi:membrane protein DedA with SNARE-associated domain